MPHKFDLKYRGEIFLKDLNLFMIYSHKQFDLSFNFIDFMSVVVADFTPSLSFVGVLLF